MSLPDGDLRRALKTLNSVPDPRRAAPRLRLLASEVAATLHGEIEQSLKKDPTSQVCSTLSPPLVAINALPKIDKKHRQNVMA